jgi:hypothetical protein
MEEAKYGLIHEDVYGDNDKGKKGSALPVSGREGP